ncbi:MAG: baeE [Anaerocolumna sp.]|jgi:malonyl CoA-acyl carrier protein transacylase|nr:baeE [Anaerocolumna sp.]
MRGVIVINLAEKKLAFIFQGVGSDYKELLDRLGPKQLDLLNEYCHIVRNEIGMDLTNYLFHAKDTIYDNMFNDWIAIYTCDCIVYKAYTALGIKPDIMLGYSMGLITALTCSNSISFQTGLHLLLTIYDYPEKHESNDEGMGVIIGKTYEEIMGIICDNSHNNQVFISSINNETCIVISGKKHSISRILDIAASQGAIKASFINSPYAFHSIYAARGINKFVDHVKISTVSKSEVPIISALTQRIIQNEEDIKDELVKNMTSPMNWKDSILKLCDLADSIIEVSLDDSLTKMSRIINLDYEFLNFKKISKLSKLANGEMVL